MLPQTGVERMKSERLVYVLYCRDSDLGDRLERALAGVAFVRARSREALEAPPMHACAIVYGVAACSDGDVEWLRSGSGHLIPPCVVVAHLSVDCLRRLYPLRSRRVQVLWADEAESRLVEVLEELERTDRGPMWHLGLGLLSDHAFRPSIRETISRVCGLHNDVSGAPFIPEHSVGHLAGQVGLASSTLSRYWTRDVPLRCSLKQFLSWAVLLWAVRARSRNDWNAVAEQVGLQRRTLERNFIRMTGCRLTVVAEDPERVIRRFRAWVDSVWDPRSANGSRRSGPAPVRAPLERRT